MRAPTRLLLAAAALPFADAYALAPTASPRPLLQPSPRLAPHATASPRPLLQPSPRLAPHALALGAGRSSAARAQLAVPVRAAPAEVAMIFGEKEEPVPLLSSRLTSVGWWSWWAQAILSTVAGVLLLFANSVTNSPTAVTLVGRALSLGGLAAALVSTMWCVRYSRLARSFKRRDVAPLQAAAAANRALKVGVALNVVGMTLCILAAEAIVGTLAAKALTQTTAALGVVQTPVQALDVLIVQANTNIIAAHFCSLIANMRLRGAAAECARQA